MDTLAYLYLAQENEDSDSRELTLNPTELSKWVTTGVLGIGCTVGVLSIADSASACYRPCRPLPHPVRAAIPYPVAHRPYYTSYDYYSYDYGSYDYGYGGGTEPFVSPAVLPPRLPAPSRPFQGVGPSAPNRTTPPPPVSSSTSESSSSTASSTDISYVDYSSSSNYLSGYLYHGNDGVASIGYYGEIVTAAQQRLKELGYYQGEVDGLFGNLTLEAVLAYQEAEGLQLVDGIIGPETRASLGIS